MRLEKANRIAVMMELGIHNCTLSLAITLSPTLLNSPKMAVPSAIYVVWMYITAAALVTKWRKAI